MRAIIEEKDVQFIPKMRIVGFIACQYLRKETSNERFRMEIALK